MQPAVVVTGASSGLGVEFARLAVAEGSKTVLIAGAGEERLFKRLRKLPVAEVARSGWEAMKAGRALCVPGIGTRAAIAVTRFAPRGLVLAAVTRLQRRLKREKAKSGRDRAD